ncbi:MAG: selenocysteine-specific translation elongation factor [Acidimicrobiia bacterium]|nr:selenocysteine-specific translation elongation factor [Acidimicrobiia bacterium]
MTVIVTAGHVDHGKSTLVRALTGIDPDRLEEERRRGLTIDLGFASMTLPSGRGIGFVDVPGHQRFVSNMLAGIGPGGSGRHLGCLLVVDAAEGWRAQSEEHLRIVDLLGVPGVAIALTKADLVDDEMQQLVGEEVEQRVAGTTLAGVPIVAVSAEEGTGLDELVQVLDEWGDGSDSGGDRPRMWIDRVFVAAGHGTVVTGTLTGGSLEVGAEVAIEPGGRQARVRRIEVHGEEVEAVGAGCRVALNIAGVGHHDLWRGLAVVAPGRWHQARVVDAELRVLAGLDHGVGRRGAYVVHIGTAALTATLRVIGADRVAAGSSGTVRLRLPEAIPCQPGDRYVLRDAGRGITIGGGELLDVQPVLPISRARPDRSVERVVTERGFVDAGELERLTGQAVEPTLGHWVAAPDAVRFMGDDLRQRVEIAGAIGLDVATLDDRQRHVITALDGVVVEAGRARRAGSADELDRHPVLARLAAEGVRPEDPEVDRAVLRQLQRRGLLIERDGVWFHRNSIDTAADAAGTLLAARPEGFTVSTFRQALDVSRRYALPLLAELDARGLTRRRGDVRVAGPNLTPRRDQEAARISTARSPSVSPPHTP